MILIITSSANGKQPIHIYYMRSRTCIKSRLILLQRIETSMQLATQLTLLRNETFKP